MKGDHTDLHVLTHSCPTILSCDLIRGRCSSGGTKGAAELSAGPFLLRTRTPYMPKGRAAAVPGRCGADAPGAPIPEPGQIPYAGHPPKRRKANPTGTNPFRKHLP